MALPDSIYQRLGGTSFPFEATGVDNTELTFEPLDPGKTLLLALLKAAINYEFSAAWTKVTNSLPTAHHLRGTSPVQDTITRQPDSKALTQTKRAFPLLALHRTGEAKYSKFSATNRQREQEWMLHYILGPLDDGAWAKVQDHLLGVDSLVDLVCFRKGHPAYASYTVFGDDQLFTQVEHTTGESGAAKTPDSDDMFFGLLMGLRTVEVSEQNLGAFEDGSGGTLTVGVGSETDGILPQVVIGDTDYPPR